MNGDAQTKASHVAFHRRLVAAMEVKTVMHLQKQADDESSFCSVQTEEMNRTGRTRGPSGPMEGKTSELFLIMCNLILLKPQIKWTRKSNIIRSFCILSPSPNKSIQFDMCCETSSSSFVTITENYSRRHNFSSKWKEAGQDRAEQLLGKLCSHLDICPLRPIRTAN